MTRHLLLTSSIFIFACSPGTAPSNPVPDASVDPYPAPESIAASCPYPVKFGSVSAFPGLPNSSFQGVGRMAGTSTGEAWAFGSALLPDNKNFTSSVAHYVKGFWNKETVDELVTNQAANITYYGNAFDISMLPSGEGWILVARIGRDSGVSTPIDEKIEIVHRDVDGKWTVIPFPEYKRTSPSDFPRSIHAFSPFDIYVCGGADNGAAHLLHYATDLTWTEQTLPAESKDNGSGLRCYIAGGSPKSTVLTFTKALAIGSESSWTTVGLPQFEPLRTANIEAPMRSPDTILLRANFGGTTVNASFANGEWSPFRFPKEMAFAQFAETAEGHLYAAGNDGTANATSKLYARGPDGKWGDCGPLPGTSEAITGGGPGMFWVGGMKPDGTAYLLAIRE